MNKRVLIVDDEEDIQEILKKNFEGEGIEVVSALSGEEGVVKYRELFEKDEEPSLVVMDLNLAKGDMEDIDPHMNGRDERMDGVRTTKEILKINPDAIIWGYTAWSDTRWAKKLKETGAQKVIDRMVPFKEFALMVAKFLRK